MWHVAAEVVCLFFDHLATVLVFVQFVLTCLEMNVSFLTTFLQSKLDDYQAKKNKGERLNQDQLVR